MGLFRKKSARILRHGSATEERTVRTVAGQSVTVRRFSTAESTTAQTSTKQQKSKQKPRPKQQQRTDQRRRRRPSHVEVVAPPETARKQMLVRSMPHQTQIVVLEGPVLVEHYVARSDKRSLVGNVYLGKVRNVLPGMEAAFIDFGAGKNGVLYAGDVNYASYEMNGKPKRIEAALSAGDPVLVQVVKDAMGHKGARLTNQISLAGRYLVLAPDPQVRGISRRLSDDERRRLRELVGELRPEGMGVIVRTAAEGASREDIKSDIDRLIAIWEGIDRDAKSTSAPALIYQEPPLVIRVIREHFTRDFKRLLVDTRATYDQILSYLGGTESDLIEKVQIYGDEIPLFERFHVEDQLRKALDRKVWLRAHRGADGDRREHRPVCRSLQP